MTTDKTKNFFRVSAEDFKKIPGSPIAYWATENMRSLYYTNAILSEISPTKDGITTGDNDLFIRLWYETSINKIGFDIKSRVAAQQSNKKWFPYTKGGNFRKWYGNLEYVINWEQDGKLIQQFPKSYPRNKDFYFQEGLTWTLLSSGNAFGVRLLPRGNIFDVNSKCSFPLKSENLFKVLGFLASSVAHALILNINPTMAFQAGDIARLPMKMSSSNILDDNVECSVRYAQKDWDSYETSWDFKSNPLCVSPQERAEQLSYGIHNEERAKAVSLISERYMRLRCDWQRQTEEMRNLEVENNRIFIEAYGLQDELSPEVPWNEITLTCNPWYRYGKAPKTVWINGEEWIESTPEIPVSRIWGVDAEKVVVALPNGKFRSSTMPANQELENRLLADTIKEFISYAVGCMMGRYSPEKPGLILANQGSTVDDYFNILDNKESNLIDFDGVLPILDEEWFVDDIVTQFKNFVAFIFGKENLTANMDFIEAVLGKDIRKYFVKDFYKEHIQRYKKRPIYWLFSSPKGSFNALIYLHRYTPDTVSIILNEYLRELMTKISTRIKHLIEENNRTDISNADKTRNLKQIDKYTAQLAELEDYERDVIFPLAQQKIAIDLDDGVKVNYCKFGAALKKIPGLEAKEE